MTKEQIYLKMLKNAGIDPTQNFRSMSTDDLTSNFYEVYKRFVSQAITKYTRGIPTVGDVYRKEDWINGLKEYFALAFLEVKNHEKEISIGTFNPADPKLLQVTSKVTQQKEIPFVLHRNDLIDFFTNPSAAVDFVNELIDKARLTKQHYLFEEKMKILLKTSAAQLSIDFDVDTSTTGKDVADVLSEVRKYIVSLQTPSSSHIKKPTRNPEIPDKTWQKYKYSARPQDLFIIWNSDYFAGDVANLKSTLFNKSDVIPDANFALVKFSLIDGLTDEEKTKAGKIKCMVLDREALRIGYEIDVTDTTKLPSLRTLFQDIFFYGFARLPFYPIAIFQDHDSQRKFKDEIPKKGKGKGKTEEKSTEEKIAESQTPQEEEDPSTSSDPTEEIPPV